MRALWESGRPIGWDWPRVVRDIHGPLETRVSFSCHEWIATLTAAGTCAGANTGAAPTLLRSPDRAGNEFLKKSS